MKKITDPETMEAVISAMFEPSDTFENAHYKNLNLPDAIKYTTSKKARDLSRYAYYHNPIFRGIFEVKLAHVVGELTFDSVLDERVNTFLSEFWHYNDVQKLANNIYAALALDGEGVVAWLEQSAYRSPEVFEDISKVGFIPANYLNDIIGNALTGATSISWTGEDNNTYTLSRLNMNPYDDNFVYFASDTVLGNWRGFPAMYRSAVAAQRLVKLTNHRERIWELQARINAIHHYLYYRDATTSTGLKLSAHMQQNLAQQNVQQIPDSGGIVSIPIDAETGHKGELRFEQAAKGAGDAKTDFDMNLIMLCADSGIPEHWIGEGGSVTRTTADSMGAPTRKRLRKEQTLVYSTLNEILRLEAYKHFGADISIRVAKKGKRGYSYLPLSRYEFPLVFPDLSTESTDEKKVIIDAVGQHLSTQTQLTLFGFDYDLEKERKDNLKDDEKMT